MMNVALRGKPLACGLATVVAAGAVRAAVPTVTVLSTAQDAETSAVTVQYVLTGAPAVMTVDIQTNAGGNAWASIGGVHQRHWAGDVNRMFAPDAEKVRKATWVADVDWPCFVLDDSKVRAVVKAWPQDDPPDYMVADLTAPTNVCYYLDADFLPGGVNTDPYKTGKIALRRIHAANVVWMMGSPDSEEGRTEGEVLQPVKLTEDYYIGVFPVTQHQWVRLLNASNLNSWQASPDHWIHPVTSLTWNNTSNRKGIRGGDWIADGHDGLQSGTFLDVLRRRTGAKFDLPTSAQWEFACRAGTMSALYTGVSPSFTSYTDEFGNGNYSAETDAVGWCAHNNAEDPNFVGTSGLGSHAVGLKPPNPWGLYDMLGNTWDLCLDWYSTAGRAVGTLAVDPKGPTEKGSDASYSGHVWRGGDSCVHRLGSYLRAARYYSYGDEDTTMSCTGFRVVCPVTAVHSFEATEGGAE